MKTAALVVLIAAIIVGVFYLVYEDEKQWETYAREHHCRVVEHTDGQTIPMFGTDGNVHYLIVPERNTYECDGGYRVTR